MGRKKVTVGYNVCRFQGILGICMIYVSNDLFGTQNCLVQNTQ